MLLGSENDVEIQWKKMPKKFDCIEEGEMKEYVGYMGQNQAERSLKMMQPVLIQSFEDEIKTPTGCRSVISAVTGSILVKGDPKNTMTSER